MPIPTPATLEEFKEQLNKSNITPGDDDELMLNLEAATGAVEGWRAIGPLVVREFTERVVVDCGVLVLSRTPVVSLTSAMRVSDSVQYTDADVDIDKLSGMVEALSGRIESGKYDVVYQAGRDPVPEDLKLATLIIGQHMWKTQRGPRARNFPRQGSTTGSTSEQYVPGAGYLIPNQAATLMQPYTTVIVA